MSDLMDPILDRVEDALTGLTGTVTLRWGTITSADPLRLRLDADDAEIPFKPATPIPDLAEGERVLCALQHRRVTILAVAGRSYLTVDALRELGPIHYSGTVSERALQEARFGDFWHDIDGDQVKWKGASDGSWRRYAGIASVSAGAWAVTSGTNVGRTITWNIPTTLEPGEQLVIATRAVGGGYGAFNLASVAASSGGVTVITVRHTQSLATATNGGSITWWIEEVGL